MPVELSKAPRPTPARGLEIHWHSNFDDDVAAAIGAVVNAIASFIYVSVIAPFFVTSHFDDSRSQVVLSYLCG
jgi:hypothetical protein